MLLLDYWRHSGVIVRLAVCFIFSIKSQSPWRLTKGNAEMRNMSKKTWKLRVWGHMTEMQKLDYLLTKAGITHEMEREAIDFAIQEMRNNRFVTLTDIENVLSNRFHCSASSADARLRRALYVTEFRCGEYPNPELERLRAEYRVDRWSVKRFIYAAARRMMNDFD